MGRGEKYEVTLRRGRRRNLPKKILLHKDIQVKKGYTARVSAWVANTPESNIRPTINVTLGHNGDGVRFCFQNGADLVIFFENIRDFIGENAVALHESHTAAVEEFHEYHTEEALPSLNNNTGYTVIQGLRVNRNTGEIIREGYAEHEGTPRTGTD